MERLYHICGAAVLHAVKQDGLEYFHDFRHEERLVELSACPGCGVDLHHAMVGGQLTQRPQGGEAGQQRAAV